MSGYQISGNAPSAYMRYSYQFTEVWTDDLIRSAQCHNGDRVLDIAWGPGLNPDRVNQVSGKICSLVGVDLNDRTLAEAGGTRKVEWDQLCAFKLPFNAGSFDVVLCQQGLQYFSDRAKSMEEIARVLCSGGRLALDVWGALDRQIFHSAMLDGIARFLGADASAPFDLAFSLHSVFELRNLAHDAGLKDAHVRMDHRTVRFPSVEGLTVGCLASTPIAARFLSLTDQMRQALIAHVVRRLETYTDDDGLAAPMENHLLSAVKR